MTLIYARKGNNMAITNRGDSTPPDPGQENFMSSPDSYRAPTQEQAAERELLVPETDTSSNITTVNQYPQAPEVAYPAAHEAPQKRSRLGLAIGGAIAAGAVTIGGLFVAMGGSGEEGDKDTVASADEETAVTWEPGTPPTTDLLVENPEPEAATPEVAPLDGPQPVLMTATTYEGLLEQLQQNLYCIGNSPYVAVQQDCIRYMIGDNGGELTGLFQERMAAINDYRISNPDYEATVELTDPTPGDSTDNIKFINDNEVVIIAELTDPSGSGIKRYAFRKRPVTTEATDTEDEQAVSWNLFKEEAITDGSLSFE